MMKNMYYVIKTYLDNKEKFYYVKIRSHKNYDEIDFGGLRKNCLEAIVYKELNKGNIKMIQNYKDCSLYDNLKHGDETINFLQNCVSFLFYYYENMKYLELTDNSFIYCKEGKLFLPDFYTIKYGYTWYESYLDVIPSVESKEFVKLTKKLYKKNLNKKINLSLDQFLRNYYLHYLNNPKDIKIISDLFEENITFKEYLEKLFEKKIDCYYYIPIFNKIIGSKLNSIDWIIKKNSIEKYKINSIFQKIDKNIEHTNLEKLKRKILKIEKEEEIKKGGNLTGVIELNLI
jgi:hypothetical protein